MAEQGFTGRKAQFQNMQQDRLVIRAAAFKNKKRYSRKEKHVNKSAGW